MFRRILPRRFTLEHKLIIGFTLTLTLFLGLGCSVFFVKASAFFRTNQGNSLTMLAKSAATLIDARELDCVYRAQKEDSPAYRKIQATLRVFQQSDPTIRFAYTMTPVKGKTWHFVVDAEPNDSKDHSAIASEYEATDATPFLALKNPIAQKGFSTDEFGTWLTGYAPILDSRGQVKYIVGVDISAKDILRQEGQLKGLALGIFLAGILVAGFASSLFVRLVVSPRLKKTIDLIKEIAEGDGDLTGRLDASHSDELGDLAKWFNIFADRIHGLVLNVAGNTRLVAQASSELAQASQGMSASTRDMDRRFRSMALDVTEMSASMHSLSAASEQGVSDLGLIAASTEGMTASIVTVSENAAQARHATLDAVKSSDEASSQVGELETAAREIEAILGMIAEISDQTKLLALNATIEAARAGEAGKGFAVVANEVKELAKQTNTANDGIRQKIEGMQRSTEATIEEIARISAAVRHVDDITANIASSVDEQAATTKSIAENIGQVAEGFRGMARNIGGTKEMAERIASDIDDVSNTCQSVGSGNEQVGASALTLAEMSGELKTLVQSFKV